MSSCFIASADRRNSLPNTLVDRDGDHARRRVGSALFLGLSLALGHVQGVLLDAELSIVECVEVELDSLQANPPCVPPASPCLITLLSSSAGEADRG